MQAEGNDSDCGLMPVYFVPDPIRGGDNILVLCEVLNPDMTPHSTNTRKETELISKKYGSITIIFYQKINLLILNI